MKLNSYKIVGLLLIAGLHSLAFAEDSNYTGEMLLKQTPYGMEQCKVVDRDGNGLIKPGMADSGNNLENDADAWIYVPYGECAKINQGNYSGVKPEVRNKLQVGDEIDDAQTVE